jgi:hypothetical protein
MYRLLGVVVAIVALGTLATFHGTPSAAADKQLICHVTDDHGAHIIEVATAAVPHHLEEHGDCLINSTDRSLIGEDCNPTDANNNDICDVQP